MIIKKMETKPISIPVSQNSPIKSGGQMHIEWNGCMNPPFKHGLLVFNICFLPNVVFSSIKK